MTQNEQLRELQQIALNGMNGASIAAYDALARIHARIDAALAEPDSERPSWLDGGAEAVEMAKEDEAMAVQGLIRALELVVERFVPCRSEYIFSKRNALDKAQAALAAYRAQQEVK